MARRLTILEDPRYPDFVARYHADPLRFAVEVCDMTPSADQIDLLVAISDPMARVSVVSGTSTGKTAAFARIALWHFLASPYAFYAGKVEVGSNTYVGGPLIQTVADGIWKELQDAKMAIMNGPMGWIAQYFTIAKTRVTMRGFEDQWFIAQIALAAGAAVGVAGKHRMHQLVIVDEACGVPDGHFDVINGTQTQGFNRTLLASQGARSSGFFYDTHHKLSYKTIDKDGKPGAWYSLRFSSENSPFVDGKWLRDRLMETGGRDTVEYMIRVLGLFPDLSDKFLVSRGAIEKRMDQPPVIDVESDPWGHMIIIDVAAGVYRDKTVVMHTRVCGDGDRLDEDPRRLDVVKIPVYSNSMDWTDIVGRVVNYIREERLSNPTVVVDVGGQGEQFARLLERQGVPNIIKVQWGNFPFKSKNKKRFFNLRAQCSVHAAEAVKDGRMTLTKEHYKDMLDQGSRIPYHFDEKARYHIMPKEKMKELEGLPSPDLWDCICMAFLEDAHFIVAAKEGGDHALSRQLSVAEKMAAELEASLNATSRMIARAVLALGHQLGLDGYKVNGAIDLERYLPARGLGDNRGIVWDEVGQRQPVGAQVASGQALLGW